MPIRSAGLSVLGGTCSAALDALRSFLSSFAAAAGPYPFVSFWVRAFLYLRHGLCCAGHAAVVVWSAPQQIARVSGVGRGLLCADGTAYAATVMLRAS